jgi:hypothetical protein
MIYKLIHLDNEGSVGQNFVNKVGNFDYNGTRFYFSSLRSSLVEKIERVSTTEGKDRLIVTTMNSVYTFEAIV